MWKNNLTSQIWTFQISAHYKGNLQIVKMSTQVHQSLPQVASFSFSWDSGCTHKHKQRAEYTLVYKSLLFFFAYGAAERHRRWTVRPVRAEFHQNRADQFGFVSASPEAGVSMYSCLWKSAWSLLRQKLPLIFSPLCSSSAPLVVIRFPPSPPHFLPFFCSLRVWLWQTVMEMNVQGELKAPLPCLNRFSQLHNVTCLRQPSLFLNVTLVLT